jgi:hypothetical protein
MNFEFVEDRIQVFINEHLIPGNIVLVIGGTIDRSIFDFLKCEVIFVSNLPGADIVVDYTHLPFEDKSFDLVINFVDNLDVTRISKSFILT